MSLLQAILSLSIVLQAVLFFLSIRNLRQKNYQRRIHYYLYLFGAFVWEDMVVISAVLFIASIILFFLNNLTHTLVFILLFIIMRTIGEMIYSLFQQFHQPGYRPFDYGLKNLGNVSIHIIYQVKAVAVITLATFLLYLALHTS